MTDASADAATQERGVAALDALDRDTLVEILFHSCHLALRDWARRVAQAAPFERLAVLLEVAAGEVDALTQAELVEAHSGLKPLGSAGMTAPPTRAGHAGRPPASDATGNTWRNCARPTPPTWPGSVTCS